MTKRMLAIFLLLTLVLVGCGKKAGEPAPTGPNVGQGPSEPNGANPGTTPATQPGGTPVAQPGADSFQLDKAKTIKAIQDQINTIVTDKLELGATRWMVSGIALLGPAYAIVDYEDGHVVRRTLFKVEEAGGQLKFTAVLHGDADPRMGIEYDWKMGQ